MSWWRSGVLGVTLEPCPARKARSPRLLLCHPCVAGCHRAPWGAQGVQPGPTRPLRPPPDGCRHPQGHASTVLARGQWGGDPGPHCPSLPGSLCPSALGHVRVLLRTGMTWFPSPARAELGRWDILPRVYPWLVAVRGSPAGQGPRSGHCHQLLRWGQVPRTALASLGTAVTRGPTPLLRGFPCVRQRRAACRLTPCHTDASLSARSHACLMAALSALPPRVPRG